MQPISPMILPKVASSYRSGVDDASTFVSGGMTLILERQTVVFSQQLLNWVTGIGPEIPERRKLK
jgi:hypothetical protein